MTVTVPMNECRLSGAAIGRLGSSCTVTEYIVDKGKK